MNHLPSSSPRNFSAALVGSRSDQGPYRTANEDACWVSDAHTPTELGALYIVADGVGGQEHGAAAAQQAIRVVRDAFYQLRGAGEEIPAALNEAILRANQAVYEQAQARGGGKMGCTLVTAVQHEGQLYIAHVGDARAYLLMENRLRQLTRDDTWVQRQVEAGIITPEEAAKHEFRNVVTQVLGNKLEIKVHLSPPRNLYTGNILLLCTDGVHGVLSDEQLYLLLKSNRPQEAADALVQAAIEANTKDNVTAVVVNSGQFSAETMADIPATPVASPAAPATLPDAPVQRRRSGVRLPLWALATLSTAVTTLIILAFVWLWPSGAVSIDLGGGVEGEGEMAATDTAVPPPSTPTSSPATPLPVEVAPATAVPQPMATNPPPPTDMPTPRPTLTPPPLMGCVVGGFLFVWSDDQMQTNTCDQFSNYDALEPGDQVRILNNAPISVAGPDESCLINNFIKIESVENPEITGWVISDFIRPMRPGESCPP